MTPPVMRGAPDQASALGRLIAGPMRPGLVRWIGLRPVRREDVVAVAEVAIDIARGIEGDHYNNGSSRTRQVSLIQSEHLVAIAAYLGRDALDPALLRRNIVVSGINLLALKGQRFQIGAVVLETTGECHPCSRMEEAFGPGGYNAVRGHGGIIARVVAGGRVAIGDAVNRVDAAQP